MSAERDRINEVITRLRNGQMEGVGRDEIVAKLAAYDAAFEAGASDDELRAAAQGYVSVSLSIVGPSKTATGYNLTGSALERAANELGPSIQLSSLDDAQQLDAYDNAIALRSDAQDHSLGN